MNPVRLYVGNLPYEATSKDLIDLFSQFGDVMEAMIIPDKFNPTRSKGFGFVTFSTQDDAQKAISLHQTDFKGRLLVVQPAQEKPANGTPTNNPNPAL